MTLEELIYQQLANDAQLRGLLAIYAGGPSIFEGLAPEDSDPDWAGHQTPRIEYIITRQEDPERQVSGHATFSIFHRGESMAKVAQVEARLKSLLDGAVFRPDEGTVFLRWSEEDVFDEEPDYRGIEVRFDMLAFPSQLTFSPDPIAALNIWAAAKFPELQVDPAAWAPTDANPAVYWRLGSYQEIERWPTVRWVETVIAGHVLTPGLVPRTTWVRKLAEGAMVDTEMAMDDGSWLYIQKVSADSSADHLREGQIKLTVKFGILLPEPAEQPMNAIYITGEGMVT